VTDNYRKITDIEFGAELERKRILALIANYWCGEENCRKHGTDWLAFIKEIENENE